MENPNQFELRSVAEIVAWMIVSHPNGMKTVLEQPNAKHTFCDFMFNHAMDEHHRKTLVS